MCSVGSTFTQWYLHGWVQCIIEFGDLLTCTPTSQLCSHMQGWYGVGMHYVYDRVAHVQDMVEKFTVS